MGFYHELGTLLDLKKQLAYTRCARGQSILPCFGRLRLSGKMIICARLRLAKIIFFRVLIKYLTHNHPHITTILQAFDAKF